MLTIKQLALILTIYVNLVLSRSLSVSVPVLLYHYQDRQDVYKRQLVRITVVFDIQSLDIILKRIELYQSLSTQAGMQDNIDLFPANLCIICPKRKESLFGTNLSFGIIYNQLVGIDTYSVIVNYSHINYCI